MNAALNTPVLAEVSAIAAEMVALRQTLHANPELGFEEHQTSELVASQLERWGYVVHRGVGRTGVLATLQNGLGKRLGLRADGLFERFPCDALYAFHNAPGYAAGLLGSGPG